MGALLDEPRIYNSFNDVGDLFPTILYDCVHLFCETVNYLAQAQDR